MDSFLPPAELTAVRDQALQIATAQAALDLSRAFRGMTAKNFEQTFPEAFDSISSAISRGQRAAIETSTWYLEEAVRTTTGRPIMLADAIEQAGVTARGKSVTAYVRRTPDVVAARVAAGVDPAEALAMSQRQLLSLAQTEPYRLMRNVTARVASTDGNFAGWRRLPEPGACPFCRMLATRGAAYLSQASAQVTDKRLAYHNRCKCTAVPVVASEVRAVNAAGAAEWQTMPRPAVSNSGTRSTGRARGRRAGGPAAPLTPSNTLPGAVTPERFENVKLQIGQIESRLGEIEARAAAGDASAIKAAQWNRNRLADLRREFDELDKVLNPKPIPPVVPKAKRTPKPKPEPAPTPVPKPTVVDTPATVASGAMEELDMSTFTKDNWEEHPLLADWLDRVGRVDMYRDRKFADNRIFWDPKTKVGVVIDKKYATNEANIKRFLQTANEAVEIARPNLPTYRRDRITIFEFNGKAKGSVNAQTMLGGTTVEVNRNQLGLMSERGIKTRKSKQIVENWSVVTRSEFPVLDTLVHELGHQADIRTGLSAGTPQMSAHVAKKKALYAKWRGVGTSSSNAEVVDRLGYSRSFTKEQIEKLNEIVEGPTVYARTDPEEMYAEAFAAWNLRAIRPIPASMTEWVNDFVKEFGWT